MVFATSSIVAQELRFDHITNSDGLSQSVVNCLLEDKLGFIWIGTQDGLNKYDGYSIVVIKNNPHDSLSISGNNILSLYEDNDGIIWIGTYENGLNSYNRLTRKFTVYKNVPDNKKTLINNTVRSIVQDVSGILWFGTEEGLCSFNKKTEKFTRYNPLENGLNGARIWCVANSKDDKQLLLATFGEGVHVLNKRTKHFHQLLDTNSSGILKVPKSSKVRTVFEDSKGFIWIGTNNAGLIKYTPNSNTYEYFVEGHEKNNISNERIRFITEMKDGKLWIGTFNGLNIFNPETKEFTKYFHKETNEYSLASNNLTCILNSDKNITWIGTDGNGLDLYKHLSNRFTHYFKEENKVNTLTENTVMSILEINDSNLWIGTLGGGINILNRVNGKFKQITFPENKIHSRILALHQDKSGLVWIGSWGGGVNYFDPKTNQFSIPFEEGKIMNNSSLSNNTVVDIKEDNEGNIWFATLNGLNKFDVISKSFINYFTSDGLINNNVTSLYFDDFKNELYVGTNDGLCKLIFKSNKFVKIDLKKQNVIVNSMVKIDDNNLLVATNNGLAHVNTKTKQVRWFYEVDGLPNEYIYGLVKDNKNTIWFSSNYGLAKFDWSYYIKNDHPQFKNYFEIDGLQSNEFNQGAYSISPKNEIFFGGINGFNSFFPNNIVDNPHKPPVYITSFKIFEKEVELDSSIFQKKYIELSYRDRFFSFEFVGLDYNLPSKNLYSWKLEGFDDEWTPPTKRRYISYNNLPGGNYVLRIRASNNDGIWNEIGATLHIKIVPPIWKTNWFYGFCVLFLIIGIILFVKIREQKLIVEKRILSHKVAERTIELQEKNKDILSSINYAKRIQEAILPPISEIKKHLPESFVVYSPKDIVSGDFYWFGVKNNKIILAVVDCTGHGVPGAFMSMIGHNLLNQIILEEEVLLSSEILGKLDSAVVNALKQDDNVDSKDGMDMSLIVYDIQTNILDYSGAYRPLYLIKNNQLIKVEANKYPIGGGKQMQVNKLFKNHQFNIEKGDSIVLFSDGYPDQFGGIDVKARKNGGKKIMVKQFQNIVLSNIDKSMDVQKDELENFYYAWKGDLDQVDDILIVCVRF